MDHKNLLLLIAILGNIALAVIVYIKNFEIIESVLTAFFGCARMEVQGLLT